MRILVTGGAGFIGKNLILKLLSSPNNVVFNIDKLNYASHHRPIEDFCSKTKNKRYKFLNIDLANESKTFEALNMANPEIIFHLAAESHVDRSISKPFDFIKSNIIGTYNLLSASLNFYNNLKVAKKERFKFLHISTDEVFGTLGSNGHFSENSKYDPRSPYSASKASSDHLVKAWHHTYSLPVIISNCSNNYGPWQYPEKLIPKIILSALSLKKIPIYGDGLNTRDWIFVKDHINCLISLASRGEIGERYCIGSNTEKTNLEIAKIICNYLDNKEPSKISYSDLIYFVNDRPGHDLRYAINPAKINNKLKWFPKYNFQESLEETINWYINNVSIFK